MKARLLRRLATEDLRQELAAATADVARLRRERRRAIRQWARAVATGRAQQLRADRLERELADALDKADRYRARWLRADAERSDAQVEADRLAAQMMRRGIRPESSRPLRYEVPA